MSVTNEHDSRSPEELNALFRDQQWLITCRTQDNGSYHRYLSDLIDAWKAADAHARQQLRAGQAPTALADCIRYALIHTTIVGNLGNSSPIPTVYTDVETPFDPQMLIELVPEQEADSSENPTLASVGNIHDPTRRANALIELASAAANEELETIIQLAIESILSIQAPYWVFPSYLWEDLTPYFNHNRFSKYVAFIFSAANDVALGWFIELFAKKMTYKMQLAAFRSALSIQDVDIRARALRRLLPLMKGKKRARLLQVMSRSVDSISEPRWKTHILFALIDKVKGVQRARLIRQAMITIPLIVHYSRSWEARRLMPYLRHRQRVQFLKKVLNAKGLDAQLTTYIALWWYLPRKKRQQTLNLALSVREPSKRAKYLAQIGPKLRTARAYQEAVQHIVNAILKIRNEDIRHTTLLSVRDYMQDEAIDRIAALPIERLTPNIQAFPGYRFAFVARDSQSLASALGNLSRFMSSHRKTQSLPLMVDLSLEIDLHDYVAQAIKGIAPYLDDYHLEKALEGALHIGENWLRVCALTGLAPFLKGHSLELCLNEAVATTGLLSDTESEIGDWSDVDMAARLLPHFNGEVRQRILERGLAATRANDYLFDDQRNRFLPYLENQERVELITAILDNIPNLQSETARARTLNKLVPFLPEPMVVSAIKLAQTIQDRDERESALSSLIPHLGDSTEALKLAKTLESPNYLSGALIALLPQFAGNAWNQLFDLAITVTEKIEHLSYRMERWASLLSLSNDPHLLQQKMGETMLDYLWSEKDNRRNTILAFCSVPHYLSALVLPSEVLEEIGKQVMQICLEWKW